MIYVMAKLLLTAALVVLVSEVAKRSGFLGGLLASLPLVSFLAMIWLYAETKDSKAVAELSASIFWLVLPSLSLFVTLPFLLRRNLDFYLSMALSTIVMFACYGIMLLALRWAGFRP